MKTNYLLPFTNQTSFYKKGFLTAVLLCFLLLSNTVFSYTYPEKPKTPKITSSYNCAPPAPAVAAIQPLRSGSWNDASVWPGNSFPTVNDDVTVPAEINLTMVGTCRARTITVMGKLKAVNWQEEGAWVDLEAKYIMVMGANALFEIGTKTNPYLSQLGCVITLKGNNRNELIPGTSVNSKAIMVMNGATMNLHGAPKVSWVKIGAQTTAGSTSITLAEPVDWEVGDEIVITPNRLNPAEAETRVITNISNNQKTISFDAALQFPRMGELKNYSNGIRSWTVDTRAEVGLLSRNIKIQGDNNTTDANRYGAHIMIMNGATANADNVEFFRMGQGGTLGRYPWHWHLLGPGGEGQYISNCSIRKSYNRAITVHGTWGTLVDNNVAFDHLGHGIFLEDGSEINNTFSKNLVLLSKKPRQQDALLDSDFEFNTLQNKSPSAFWITNPGNTFKDNIVAGTEGTAYWFAMPDKPTGASESLPALSNLQPRRTDLIEFSGNVAHSTGNAFDANDMLDNQHRLLINRSIDSPNPFLIQDFTVFSNKLNFYTGIGSKDEDIIFDNAKSADTEIHVMLATRHIIRNSIFIADTDNDIYNVNTFRNQQTHLYNLYDGAGRIYDSHFVNWNRNYTSVFRTNGAGEKRINHLFRGITYNHKGTPRIKTNSPKPTNNIANRCSQVWSDVIRDLDGSLTRTGVPSSLITDIPFYTFDNTHQVSNWDGLHSVSNKFVYINHVNNQPVRVTRKDLTCNNARYFQTSDCELGKFIQLHLALDDGKYEHSIYFDNLTKTQLDVNVNSDLEAGGDLTIRYKGFGRLNGVNIAGVNRENSIDAVRNSNSTAYYVEPNGDLYLKFVTTNSFKGQSHIIRWNSGSLPSMNEYEQESNLINAYVTTSNQSGCNARATFHIANNPNHTNLEISLNGGENYTEVINDNVGSKAFNNIPIGTLIYARWQGQSCGMPIGLVKNNRHDSSCDTQITIDNPTNTPPLVCSIIPYININSTGWQAATVANINEGGEVWFGPQLQEFGTTENGWSWKGPNNFTSNTRGIRLSNLQTNQAGTYIVINTDTNGCTTSLSYTLNITAIPDPVDPDPIVPIAVIDIDGDGRPDELENQICGNMNNASDLNFEFNQNNEGFTFSNIAATNTSSNVSWLIRADNSNDPFIVKSGLRFNGSQVPQLSIRAKSEATGAFQLFWTTTDAPNFAQARSVMVTPQTTNVYQELIFDMRGFNTWMEKTITRIRLDFPPDTSASRYTSIDYIHGPDASDSNCDNPTKVYFNNLTQTPFNIGKDIGVTVYASDGTTNGENISNVSLSINGQFVRQENSKPYEWGTANQSQGIDPILRNLSAGVYTLEAIATDNDGNTATATLEITVQEAVNPIVHIRKANNIDFALDGNFGGENNQNVYLWSANPNNINQQWEEINRGNGYYSYRKLNTTFCLESSNDVNSEQNVRLWTYNENYTNQQWKKIVGANGRVRLEKRSDSTISLNGGNGGINGQNVFMDVNNATGGNQQWVIEVIGTVLSNKSILRATSAKDVIVYPNPTTANIYVDLKSNTNAENILILNIQGQLIKTIPFTSRPTIVDLSELSNGIYFIKINIDQQFKVVKVIKNSSKSI